MILKKFSLVFRQGYVGYGGCVWALFADSLRRKGHLWALFADDLATEDACGRFLAADAVAGGA